MELERLDLMKILGILRRFLAVILLCTVIGGLAGGLYTKYRITPLYQSYANLILYNRGSALLEESSSSTVTADQLNNSAEMVNTYAVILKSEKVMEKVVAKLQEDYPGKMDWVTPAGLSGMVNVTQVGGTQVVQISVTTQDQTMSTMLVSAVVEVAPDEIVDILKGGSVEVLNTPKAGGMVYPSVKRNAVLSAGAAFVITVVIVLLISIFDRSIRTEEDIVRQLDLPVLGIIPRMEDER
ncbi:MAG: hypothetical protein IJN82_00185 [Clostridia bacterium]|nr:hypothetical protein [Clostridia bacterium]